MPPVPSLLRRHPGWWALWLLSKLPLAGLYVLADVLAALLYYVVSYRRRVVTQNLARSFPEKTPAERTRIARRFYRNLAELVVETVKMASITPAEMARRFQYRNAELLTERLRQSQVVLVLGSHQGNWEWMLPAAQTEFGAFRVDAVYHPLTSGFGEALFTYLRTRLGGQLVKMPDVGRDVVRLRSVPRALCLIADQTPPGGQIQFFTTFLHQDTPFFVGTDKLAAAFRLPVLYFSTRRLRRGYYEGELRVLYDGRMPLPAPPRHLTDDPADHPITEAYARALEADVRAQPETYLWSHRRWKNARR